MRVREPVMTDEPSRYEMYLMSLYLLDSSLLCRTLMYVDHNIAFSSAKDRNLHVQYTNTY